MDIKHIAAFSTGDKGGNPAGVVLGDSHPSEAEMRRIAAELNYSETVFAMPVDGTQDHWRARYFSPESEVPFCGHATIALGAVLGQHAGAGRYQLRLNEAEISVEATPSDVGMTATLASPPTRSRDLHPEELRDALNLFGLTEADLDSRLQPAFIHGGADHFLLPLNSRATLARMSYDLDAGREMMNRYGIVTVMLVHIHEERVFDVRNAFASGGVLEDPATGAAAAAFAGRLRDVGWPHGGSFTLHQGEDMGAPSRIHVSLSEEAGSSVQVTGTARDMRG